MSETASNPELEKLSEQESAKELFSKVTELITHDSPQSIEAGDYRIQKTTQEQWSMFTVTKILNKEVPHAQSKENVITAVNFDGTLNVEELDGHKIDMINKFANLLHEEGYFRTETE